MSEEPQGPIGWPRNEYTSAHHPCLRDKLQRCIEMYAYKGEADIADLLREVLTEINRLNQALMDA